MQMEERILAEGCRMGDNTARRELYDRYAGRLLAICMRYVGERATAEDLLHDAFLKIYGAFDRFSYRGPGSLRAWIERITGNVALECLRNRNRPGVVQLEEGRAAGIEEGRAAEAKETAKRLYAMNVSIETIAKGAKASIEDVQEWIGCNSDEKLINK